MKKKILSVLLAVVMLASACSMMIVPVSAATTLSTDNSGAYLISSAADVETFRTMMIGGETFAGKTVKLTADIDMTDLDTTEKSYVYTMDNTQGHGFMGTFDGQGYTISNLIVDGNKSNGFFGWADGDSTNWSYENNKVTIKNLAFVNSKSVSNTGKTNVGLLYGAVYGATINVENVYVDTIMYSPAISGNMASSHGGLVGYTYGMHLNIKNTVLNVKTETEGCTLRGCGAIGGVLDGGTVNKLTFNQSALFGDVYFSLTHVAVGAKSGVTAPEVSLENAITDIKHGLTGGTYNGPSAVGLWKQSASIYETANVTKQDVSGIDATAVEGFTATVGHMVPTSLLKMFPQHCLETSTADGAKVEFEGYQTTNLVDGKAKVRLVATLADDYKNYDEVGFEVVAVYEKDGVKTAKSQKVACTKVYSSISAVTGNEAYPASISASSLIGGEGYIFAMVITGVPEGITLQVRTYSVSGETTTYGATEVFTIADIPGGTVGGN